MDVPVGLWCHVAATDGEALAAARRAGHADPDRPDGAPSLLGSADAVIEQAREYERRLGATHLLLRPEVPGMDQATAMRRIELLAGRVLPALRAPG